MSLIDNLIEYWPLNEASGSRAGAHAGLTLTDNNSVGSNTGLVYSLAADFERSLNNQFLSRANQAALQMGDINCTFALWVNFEDLPAGDAALLFGKTDGINPEYRLVSTRQISSPFRQDVFFDVFTGAAEAGRSFIDTSSLASLTLSVWHLIISWHDATANTINLQVDNGTVLSAAHSGGIWTSTNPLWISQNGASHDGLMGPYAFWKRLLNSDERTQLYNGGAGLTYAAISTVTAFPFITTIGAKRI